MTRLTIERIECIPLSMPLARTFRGSNYFMTHRCTIITRLYTREGIVGECYNGDEFETQAEVIGIVEKEIAPLLIVIRLSEFRYADATAIAVVMLVVSFLIIFVVNRLQRWAQNRVAAQ